MESCEACGRIPKPNKPHRIPDRCVFKPSRLFQRRAAFDPRARALEKWQRRVGILERSTISAMIGIMGVWLRHAGSPQSILMFTVACSLGMVGINSRRWRRLAYLSLLTSAGGIIFLLWALAVGRIAYS